MKTFFFTILSVLYVSPSISQTVKPEAVIDNAIKTHLQWEGMDIQFSANVRSDDNQVSESFEGSFSIKEKKFLLKTPEMITWFDGKTQWTYLVRNDEVNVSEPAGDELKMINPMQVLKDYKKDFTVSYIGESTSANAKLADDIALTPRKKDDISKIELQIEKSNSMPVKLTVTMKNKIRNVFSINQIKAVQHPDEIFTFPEADYPDVEVIDLR